ncbi:Hpt domain-containing protein [Paraferrimonas sp. SM1919]|uniref:Hpt domain-containing protein n=1 Tax=Paraferrimonas sp. SM1919 TaxID=2662263 RepID=UPI0013D6DD37|nr:Hpt domain-containing protein [Paraferrimonas sp. SM1919]
MNQEPLNEILDLHTLEQYITAIGAATLLKSVVLFEGLMPEYIAKLESHYKAQEKKALCEEAHKFKGAAGSVGLLRLHMLAENLQHGEREQWQEQHPIWIEAILSNAQADLKLLSDYLNSKC